jgi:hypothetical protein
MFTQKLAVLIGVATPLDLTLATSFSSLDFLRPSRAASIVRKGLEYFLGVLSSQNFRTRLIITDGEGAVAKLITELNALGIEVDISGAGGHLARVERRIQVLKERVRTTDITSPLFHHCYWGTHAYTLLCIKAELRT